jgi:hypothetical protein
MACGIFLMKGEGEMKHNRRFLIAFSICALILLPVSRGIAQAGKAAEFTVAYLDGTVELQSAAKWMALSIGDKVLQDAMVRVAKDSSMQLSRAGLTLSFLTPGSFSVSDIMAKTTQSKNSGLSSALGKTAAALTGTNQKVQKTGTLGGARASEAVKPKDTLWVDELDEVRTKVNSLFAEQKFADAVKLLEKTRAEGLSDDENVEVSFLLASANYSQGETVRAWKAVADQNPAPSSKFYSNILLMKAQLLMESSSFPEAIDVLNKLTGPAVIPETAQQAWLMAGLCNRFQGNEQAAKDAWNKGLALVPGSDTAKLITDTMNGK